jgi:hypothetical protein
MFLRQYSKDNNISYSCAITEAAPSYRKMKEEMKNKEEELPRAADPKIFSKMIKVKKQKPKKIEKKQKQKEEEEEEEEEEKPLKGVLDLPKAADNPDIISNELQQLLFVSGTEKIKNALNKLKFKGRLQTNPIMRNMQVLQNFNTVKKMKELIKELKGMK